MSTLSELIDQVKTILIQTEGNKPRHEVYNEFINECKALNLTEEEFYRDVLKPASKSIDWDAIEADKKSKEDEQKKKTEDAAKAEEQRTAMLAQIMRDVQYCIDAGIVEPKELKSIFFKAAAYRIDTDSLAKIIQSNLDNKKFKPCPKPDITLASIEDKLSSTTWYDEKHYPTAIQHNPSLPASATPQPKPNPQAAPSFDTKAKSRSGSVVLILFLLLLVVGGYLFLKNTNRYSSGYKSTDSTAMTTDSTTAMPDTSHINASGSDAELSDQEKADISSFLTTFYNYENLENVEGMLSYFSFPVSNYYKIYTNVSYDKLKGIFTKSFTAMSSHHITIDMNQSTVQKTAEGYVVRVYANYQFSTQKVPNGNRDVRIVMYLNADKRITSIYEL